MEYRGEGGEHTTFYKHKALYEYQNQVPFVLLMLSIHPLFNTPTCSRCGRRQKETSVH